MYCVLVAYPKKDGTRFDFDYYSKKHVPMVAGFMGANAVKTEVRKGLSAPDGSPPAFVCVATFWIKSVDDFKATLGQHGPQILGDIPNYTNIEPIIQVDEVIA